MAVYLNSSLDDLIVKQKHKQGSVPLMDQSFVVNLASSNRNCYEFKTWEPRIKD